MIGKRRALLGPLIILTGFVVAFSAQRQGGLDSAKLGPSLLVSNGPAGPIRGGESAVTDMVLMPDGRDGKLYLLGGRDYDNSWLLCYDPAAGSLDCLGWPTNTAQCGVICADREGRILMAENLRNSYIYVYEGSR